MSRLIPAAPLGALDADECLSRAEASGVDPRDEAGLASLADDLAALSADRGLVARVAERVLAGGGGAADNGGYGAQALLLAPPGRRFVLRAAFWPGIGDAMLADSGPAAFFYGTAHDHDFAFLTCGHAGPGYWSDEWTLAAPHAGIAGEPAALAPIGRHRLASGSIAPIATFMRRRRRRHCRCRSTCWRGTMPRHGGASIATTPIADTWRVRSR